MVTAECDRRESGDTGGRYCACAAHRDTDRPDMDRTEATEPESWYQLPAEADAGVTMRTLSETAARGEHTDFPSLEEGTLLSETELGKGFSAGRTTSLRLGVQDSRLSPCLPLMTTGSTTGVQDSQLSPCLPLMTTGSSTGVQDSRLSPYLPLMTTGFTTGVQDSGLSPCLPLMTTGSTTGVQDSRLSPHLHLGTSDSNKGRKFFEDTLFQKTDDFFPLRASLDMSEFPGPPSKSLQMSDAVELASKEVMVDQEEGSVSLSQRYLSISLEDADDGGSLQYLSQHPLSYSSREKVGAEPDLAVEKPRTSEDLIQPVKMGEDLQGEDGAFLSSDVPAPVLLQLLEKEVGMSSSSRSSSTRSSKSSSTARMKPQEPETHQNLNTSEPDVHLDPRRASNQSLEESFRDSSTVDFLKDVEKELEDPSDNSQVDQSGITLRPTKQPPLRDTLQKQLCLEIQQRYKDGDTTKGRIETGGLQSTPVLNMASTELPKNDTTEEANPREELSTSSHCSIERGHKDAEMSHIGQTPVDEASFMGKLPRPISQSTPGTFTMNRKPLAGRIQQIKAKLTGSDMSLNEEPSTETSPPALPQSVQSSQEYPESSDSQRSSSPQRRRIQSLPSLSYIEKVGAWNTNQSFDALVLRGLTGMSPKKLAYNAVADSLNRMLSRQAPQKGPSFKAASSMTNLSVAEKEAPTTSQITRSQSYNSVLPGRNPTEAAVRPVEEVSESTSSQTLHSHVSLTGSSTTRDGATKRVVENTVGSSVGDHGFPAAQTSSQKGQEKASDTSGTRSRNFVAMDRFSDVSSDQDYASSSHSSNHDGAMLRGSLAKEGGATDWPPTDQTGGKEELDIEERIPTYLRNLGIDQSPTSILTPFGPKGPIREPEFSPSELRTIKGSTATPSRSMKLSEGGSQGVAVNISLSSLFSSASTTSVSIPMGSEVGPESPLPFGSGSANDRPISQDDTMIRGVGCDLGGLSQPEEMSPPIQPASSKMAHQGSINEDNMESARVKQLVEQFEGGGRIGTTSLDDGQAGSLQGFSEKPPVLDPTNDSFVGSKTLKEIRELLAEDVGLDRASPLGDPYTESPSGFQNLEDSLRTTSTSPLNLLLKDMSWDSSFTSSFTGDHVVHKDSPETGNIDSQNGSSIRDSSYVGELVGGTTPLAALQSQWGRSEPEGCSKATTDKTATSAARLQEAQAGNERDVAQRVQRSQQLLSSVSRSVGGLENVLAATGTGYIRGRESESDESSGDSLAARVTNLLKNGSPLTYRVRATQRAEEEDRRARGSVKLKLTGHAVTPDTDLSHEDRRRIEEIKRELLDRAKDADKGSSNTGEFRLRLTPSPFQLPVIGSHDSMEGTEDTVSDVQHNATHRGMTKDESSMVSDQPQPTSGSYQQDPRTELHVQKEPRRNGNEQDRPNVKSTEEATKLISSITFSSRKLPASPDRGSPPPGMEYQSTAKQGFRLRPPSEPSVSPNVHHVDDLDASLSPPADKDVDPAVLTSNHWRPGESTTQERSASSWPVDGEYSAAVPIQWTFAPSVETFSTISCPQREYVDPGWKNVNSEGSLVISHGHQVKVIGEDSRLETYHGLRVDGLSSREPQTKLTASPPNRKALSCVHVKISPKEDLKVLDLSKALDGLSDPRANVDLSRSPSPNLSRNHEILTLNNLSAGTVPPNSLGDVKAIHPDIAQFTGKENLPDRLIQPDRRRSPLSDATTQITTESPEKTTFSAEIFVNGTIREASTSSILKVNQTPERQMTSRTPLSCLSRATDQPLLLPYRPPGSPELFYVPFMEGGSRMSPVSTIESSHPGSNDAISPKFPPDVLGSATEKLSDPSIPKHREGIYSKEPSPNQAEWKQRPARGLVHDVKSSAATPQRSPAVKDSGSNVHPRSSKSTERSDTGRLRLDPASSSEDNEFLPLQPEIDYSQERSDLLPRSRVSKKMSSAVCSDLRSHKSAQTHGQPLRSSLDRSVSRSHGEERSHHSVVSMDRSFPGSHGEERSRHGVVSNQSLDDLWARYTQNQRSAMTQSSNSLEMSLVERLERLARLLQTPPPRSLMSSKEETRVEDHLKTKKAAREQWYRRKLGADHLEDDSVSKPYEDSPDGSSVQTDVSCEVKSTETDSATAVTESQAGSDASSRTSTSASTIDTIRLINAFGPERVLPSSRLGRLYGAIDLQKRRTEKTAKGSKDASAGRGRSRMEMQELLKSRSKVVEAESVASSDSFWEPSPALKQKKGSRGVNKGVQAGELEIVMSATRRNTRDVGTTFPSPGGDRLASEAAAESGMRTSRSRVKVAAPYVAPGLSWFVPAENLKAQSRKENEPRVRRGPGPAWYEPVTGTKPWREPLRERNEQDGVTGRADGSHYRGLPGARPTKPLVKVTLQESLRSQRPDFIFRSGERVKRLQLLAEERKLQSVFQGERDELFNRGPRSGAPRYKDAGLSGQIRSIPKKEMVERSKRIYQQLPEIRKRKEEEKRRSENEANRLRAQLYRRKLTNHVLGRKTPWN